MKQKVEKFSKEYSKGTDLEGKAAKLHDVREKD